MSRFQVLFSGQVAEGASETTVRQNLMRRLGLDERKVSQLFSGRTVVIRSDLTREAADDLQGELAQMGAIARIKDLTPDDKAKFKIDAHVDQTLKDITAAHIECPRCGHLQLEAEYCARCGVDISTANKLKRKEDLLIEKKIREFKGHKPSMAAVEPAATSEHPVAAHERLQPIKRRPQRPVQTERPHAPAARRGASPQRSESSGVTRDAPGRLRQSEAGTSQRPNPFGGGFWRNVLKLGRKDERGH
jgi:ribosomal protein L37E